MDYSIRIRIRISYGPALHGTGIYYIIQYLTLLNTLHNYFCCLDSCFFLGRKYDLFR